MTGSELDVQAMTADALTAAELVIQRGRLAFVEVGSALLSIRDGRGYRIRGYSTFEAYCQNHLGFSRGRGYQLIEAAQVVAEMSTQVDNPASLPVTERQARELVPLSPTRRLEAVRDVDLSQLRTREVRNLVKAGRDELTRRRPTRRAIAPDPIDESVLHPEDRFTVCDAKNLIDRWGWRPDEPANGVHLWVTSPPYALDQPYHEGGDIEDYDGWLGALCDWLTVMHDLSVYSGRLCLNVPLDRDRGGWEPVSADVVHIARDAGWRFRTWILWQKGQAGSGTDRGSVNSATAPNVTAAAESVLVFYRDKWERPGPASMDHQRWLELCGPRGVWSFPGVKGNDVCPSPFPPELPANCIELFSFPNDVVADPFVGLGTTAGVAARMGRIVWAADRDPRCVEAARALVARERGLHA